MPLQASLILALFVVLALARVPVAFALLLAGAVGLVSLLGVGPTLSLLSRAPLEAAASWELSAVPMFLLMGSIVARSGMADGLFLFFLRALGWLPGGLAIATNFACAAFGAASGSSLAATVGVGRLAIPEMRRHGYAPQLAAGVSACGGTLAALIPPSIPFIVFAILTEQSPLALFAAGVVPGLLTAIAYAAMIALRCARNPSLAGGHPSAHPEEGTAASTSVLPIVALAVGVFVGLYGGFATPTEAGGLGALLAAILAAVFYGLRWRTFLDCVRETARTTSAILIIAVGASVMTTYLSIAGFPQFVAEALRGFGASDLAFLLAISLAFLMLGMFLDPLGVMLLATPIFLPAVQERGLDLIWFGVIVVKYIEIGLITPPVGLNLFAAHGLMPAGTSFSTVVSGAAWFLVAEAVVMVFLLAFPALSLWLPSLVL